MKDNNIYKCFIKRVTGIKKIILAFLMVLIILNNIMVVFAETPAVEPLINPLIDINDYLQADFQQNHRWHFRYNLPTGERIDKYVHGDGWFLAISRNSMEESFKIDNLIPAENVNIIYQTETEMFFQVTVSEAEKWWVKVEESGDEYRISQARELWLNPGETLNWQLGEGKRQEVVFNTNYQGDYFTHFLVNIEEGQYDLNGGFTIHKENISKTIAYRNRFNAEYDKYHILDNFPNGINDPIPWTLWRMDDGPPANIDIAMEETVKISSVETTSEELGALKVKGISGSRVEVEPINSISVSHAFINQSADITPEGDALLWLPAGYWNVKIITANKPGIDYIQSCLVPVNPAEMTELIFPDYLTNVISEPGNEGAVEEKAGLNITGIKEKDGFVTTTFSLFDPEVTDLMPTLENTTILENGTKANIREINHLNTPASIVLLLDSSGSMKGQMEDTLKTARIFLNSLPEDILIKVVDFDTKPKELQGTTKAEVLSGLNSIKADGATALYDSILLGINILEGRERPSLLVFTDGVDANWDDTGPGSVASREEVFSAVEDSGIPVYTIGFGVNHDNTVLTELAGFSSGLYYSAVDQTALTDIFNSIKNNLGNTFQLKYERPAYQVAKSVPVISIAVDTSGSMDPLRGGILQKVKNIFHDFILKLPDNTLVQLQNFEETTFVTQVMTENKTDILQALGELIAGGDNDTFNTVKTALETLQPVPSTKKILIYVSDQDLGLLNHESQEEFNKLLEKFKEENIDGLWVGFCMDNVEEVYRNTAEVSGGKYVISEDTAVLADAFDKIITEISTDIPLPEKSSLTLMVKNQNKDGNIDRYMTSREFELSEPDMVEQTVIPGSVSYKTGLPFEKYNPIIKGQLAGDDYPDQDIIVNKQIPLDVKTSNDAVEIKAVEAISLNRIKGIDAPDNRRFLAVIMEMENILPEQGVIIYPDGSSHPAAWVGGNTAKGEVVKKIPPYLISNLSSHLFLNWNNEGMYPLSPATWLAENPLLEPGNLEKFIEPGQPAQGALLFLVPDEPVEQLSLHYYDKNYGHAQLSLVGELKKEDIILRELPFEDEVKLSESFSLRVKGLNDLVQIETVKAGEDSVYRIVEADFISRVQALIDIKPAERFYHSIPTEQGTFYIPLDPVTQLLPFGFVNPTIFAPGSANSVRFAFKVPRSLADKFKGEIFVELGDGDVVIPLDSKPKQVSDNWQVGESEKKYTGDGVDLIVNGLTPVLNDRYLAADITVIDHSDGYATSLIDAFQLVRDDFDGKVSETKSPTEVTESKGLAGFASNKTYTEYLIKPDEITGQLLLGFDNETVVFDGTARRGLVVFRMPDDKDHEWTLQSDFFTGLKETIDPESYLEEDLLVEKSRPLLEDDSYKDRLNKAITQVIREYQALKEAEPKSSVKRVSIDPAETIKVKVSVPTVTFAGLQDFSQINTLDQLRTTLDGIKWLPGEYSSWINSFAPAAVLTQGWGTSADFGKMAETVLIRMGFKPEKRMVDITDTGFETLLEMGNIEEIQINKLPALYYEDEENREHLLVLPFLKDLTELDGLVEISKNQDFYTDPALAIVEVYLKVVPVVRDKNTQLRDMSNILAGGDSSDLVEEIRVFSEFINLDTLSLDAIDLGYTIVGREKGDLYSPVIETARERIIGKEKIDTGLYEIIGEKINISIGQRGGSFTYETDFTDGEDISGIFHTLGINLPDIKEAAVNRLQEAVANSYQSAGNPDELSALRWYTRNIINRFLVGQSQYERELARKLDLTLGRTVKARCLMATVKKNTKENKLQTSIDLMRVDNEIHKGEETARHAFNIFSGLYASKLESDVLSGEQREGEEQLGLFEIWQQLPENTHLVSITYDNKEDILAYMEENLEEKKFSQKMLEKIKNTNNAILVPSKPAIIKGKEHWAWLEINPDDYRTIGVLDTGEHGALLEHVLGNWQQEGLNFIVGGLIGVDAAVWSMSGFSLILDDYEEIKKQAEEFAKGLADNFEAEIGGVSIGGVGSAPSVGTSMGPVAGSFDLSSGEGSVSQNVLGYGNGFKAGVALYFTLPE